MRKNCSQSFPDCGGPALGPSALPWCCIEVPSRLGLTWAFRDSQRAKPNRTKGIHETIHVFSFPSCVQDGKTHPLSEQSQHFSGSFCLVFRLQMNFMIFFQVVLRRKYSHLVLSKINTSGHVLGCSACGSTSHLFKFLHVPSRWDLWAGARMWVWVLTGWSWNSLCVLSVRLCVRS